MKVIAAYVLCVLGGNATPSAADVTKVIEAVGATADEETIGKLIADLADKDFNEVMDKGMDLLKDVSMGGGGGGGGAAPAGGAAEAVVEEAKKEEEESAEDMGGMDMFGGGGDDY